MSLTSLIKKPDVREQLKQLRPKKPRKITEKLKVKPRTKNYMLVGTAFDYFLRFELQRRAPHAVADRWVADYAPDIIWRMIDNGAIKSTIQIELVDLMGSPQDHALTPKIVSGRTREVLVKAKAAVTKYLKLTAPTDAMRTELAGHAIRLAKLDTVYRAWRLGTDFEEAGQEDIQDLVEMLAVVPFADLLHSKQLLLNPNFGDTSLLVGGADTDMIAGDLLVDFKTTMKDETDGGHLDQILGYLLLARKQRSIDPNFPVINRVGIYYCRHGYLLAFDATTWTTHPKFLELEHWFFQLAAEVVAKSVKPNQ